MARPLRLRGKRMRNDGNAEIGAGNRGLGRIWRREKEDGEILIIRVPFSCCEEFLVANGG